MSTSFEQAIKHVYATMNTYSCYGAYDTEPRSVLTYLIDSALEGRSLRVPSTINGWQLYHVRGSGQAAKALAAAASKAMTAARRDPRAAGIWARYRG